MTDMEKITTFIDWLDMLAGKWSSRRRAKAFKNGYDWAFGTLMGRDKDGELAMLLWYDSGAYVDGARQALLDWNRSETVRI
jgi:hypothetical protein